MIQITRTIETPLQGDALRTAVLREINAMASRRPFSTARPSVSRSGQNRIILRAGTMVDGYVDMTDGRPSTVRALIRLSGLAESYESDVRRALDEVAGRLRGGTRPLPTELQEPSRERRYDPERAGRALDVFSSIAEGFRRGMEAVTGEPAEETVEEVVAREVPAPSPAVARRELRPGEKTTTWVTETFEDILPGMKDENGRSGAARGFPWGWVAVGSVAALGLVYVATRPEKEAA